MPVTKASDMCSVYQGSSSYTRGYINLTCNKYIINEGMPDTHCLRMHLISPKYGNYFMIPLCYVTSDFRLKIEILQLLKHLFKSILKLGGMFVGQATLALSPSIIILCTRKYHSSVGFIANR